MRWTLCKLRVRRGGATSLNSKPGAGSLLREPRMQITGRQTQRAPNGAPLLYERHRPGQITLYRPVLPCSSTQSCKRSWAAKWVANFRVANFRVRGVPAEQANSSTRCRHQDWVGAGRARRLRCIIRFFGRAGPSPGLDEAPCKPGNAHTGREHTDCPQRPKCRMGDRQCVLGRHGKARHD